MIRRILIGFLLILQAGGNILPAFAVSTNGSASPWSREKAFHLANATLFSPTDSLVESLYLAGSADAAVNILFPDRNGADRTSFDATIGSYTSSGFNWGDGNHTTRLYQLTYLLDPYEAKRKFFSLFEDIYAVNTDNAKSITAREISDMHAVIYTGMFGNYKSLVKKLLYNNGQGGDFAMGAFLDLFNQNNPNNPNENYARELLQLFLMGEYKPGESNENGNTRNYEESDVRALARILTGLRSDSTTHSVTYDTLYHNTGSAIAFLTGELKAGQNFPFYDSQSGTLNLGSMESSIGGSNGLTDNTIDYIFSKREREIALFLADRIYRFYIHDFPTRSELDAIADVIIGQDFDLFLVVKTFLASDRMYAETAMNTIRYKNPLELTIGTIKRIHLPTESTIDPNIYDASLLRRLNWTPYNPGSVFGRDGFDDNKKWLPTSTINAWMSASNYFTYNRSTGSIDVPAILGSYRKELTNEIIAVFSHSGNTYSGSVTLGSGVIGTDSGSLNFENSTVSLPDFTVHTSSGILTFSSGSYNARDMILTIGGGVLDASGITTPILSGSFSIQLGSVLSADILSADSISSLLEQKVLGTDIHLPSDIHSQLISFLEHDASGSLIPVTPSNEVYLSSKIRGALSLLLSLPEYILLRGSDIPPSTEIADNHLLDSITGKIVFIELYGGNDYLSSIIGKNDYSTYLDYRTNLSGSIALTGSDLVDIGPFYMNRYLAYGSGEVDSFKSLLDSGYLKIFNRVGTPMHSQDHDAAARQIASYGSTTSNTALGLFGQLVNREFDSTHTISLGAKNPNVFRGGRYINVGGSIILTNPLSSTYRSHITAMSDILRARSYPSDTASVFRNAIMIHDIGKTSVAQGGPSGASGNMKSVFDFLKVLLNNNIGRSYYMGGFGGYDTHGEQFDTLNRNLRTVAESVTTFFNSVKDSQDITLVIFSEFGRTNKVNSTLGTDHGDAGGMYVITSNSTLRSLLSNGVYGNMTLGSSKANALGVGIDYRSVYGKIFRSLYGFDDSNYFGSYSNLENDIDTTPVRMSRLNTSYQVSGSNLLANVSVNIESTNYNSGKAAYTWVYAGTGTDSLRTYKPREQFDRSPRYVQQINTRNVPLYAIRSFSNQYTLTDFTGSFATGSTPIVYGNTINRFSLTGSSILSRYTNTTAPSTLAGTGILLSHVGSGNLLDTYSYTGVTLTFASGDTMVTSVTSNSGNIVWHGGFSLAQNIIPRYFLSRESKVLSDQKMLTENNTNHIIRMGADTLGVGMILSQPVTLTYTNLLSGSVYRVVSSEDGYDWSDVESPGKLYTVQGSGTLSFSTAHFSFFALLDANTTVVSPSCTIVSSTPSVTNGSGAVLTWTLSHVQSGTLAPIGQNVISDGSLTVFPPAFTGTLYTLHVSNDALTGSCSVLITSTGTTNTGTTNTGTTNTGTTNTGTTPVIRSVGGGGGGAGAAFLRVTQMNNPTTQPNISASASQLPVQYTLRPGYYAGLIEKFVRESALSGNVIRGQRALAIGIITDINRILPKNTEKIQIIDRILDLVATIKSTKTDMRSQELLTAFVETLQTQKLQYTLHDADMIENLATTIETYLGFQYVDAERSLILRATPQVTSRNILAYLPRNMQVEILEPGSIWTKVRAGRKDGYVRTRYLRTEKLEESIRMANVSTENGVKGDIVVRGSVFVRKTPEANGRITAVLPSTTEITVVDHVGKWWEVLWNEGKGYIYEKLVQLR